MNILKIIFLFFVANSVDAPTVQLDQSHKKLLVNIQGATHQFPVNATQGLSIDGAPSIFAGEGIHLVFSNMADHEVATTFVLALDAKGKKLWTFDTEAFNNAPPLIEKKYVYLGGIGRVYKLDAKTGSVVWRHEGLFENKAYAYNGGDPIVRKNDLIVFSPTVQVKDSSGKLVEVAK